MGDLKKGGYKPKPENIQKLKVFLKKKEQVRSLYK